MSSHSFLNDSLPYPPLLLKGFTFDFDKPHQTPNWFVLCERVHRRVFDQAVRLRTPVTAVHASSPVSQHSPLTAPRFGFKTVTTFVPSLPCFPTIPLSSLLLKNNPILV
jgi:hypothetical protein